MKRKFEPVDYEDKGLRTVSRIEATSARQLTSCDSRYMTSLLVFREHKQCLELGAANVDPNHKKLQDQIEAALKALTFREQHVLIQFWCPRVGGIVKHQLLTTIDQPYGLGVDDEGFRLYRCISKSKDHEEEDCSHVARVFRLRLPEWSCDLNNCTLEQFPQKECANRCNFHGYLALPVFDLTTKLCVGVLELLTTSTTYTSYAYEVKNIHDALEVPDDDRQKDHAKIHDILKIMCDIHSVPLAQTWAVSQHATFVSHEKVIQKSCSSFDTKCVGTVCMFTTALPFHVKDINVWSFRKACIVRHLDSSVSYVGKALTCGSCFCEDVTKLNVEEYPLVHNAHMNRLTSCFAIHLHSVDANDDYVLEFFLPKDIEDSKLLLNMVQTLKQNIPIGSGFELGDTSMIHAQVVGPPMDQSANMGSDVTQTSSDSVADHLTSSGSDQSLLSTGSIDARETSE